MTDQQVNTGDVMPPPSIAFARFLHDLDGGDFHGRLSADLADLVKQLSDHLRDTNERTAKGKLTVSFEIRMGADATVEIYPKVKTELPKPPTTRKIMWVGPGSSLTPQNPRQMNLPLRTVEPTRDVRQV